MIGSIPIKTATGVGVVIVLALVSSFFVETPVGTRKPAPALLEEKSVGLSEIGADGFSREPFKPFGSAIISPEFFLDGVGTNIDSPEFFEADNHRDTLLLVSGKGNDTVEVWKFPFQGNQLTPLKRDSQPNGLDIDQDKNFLLIGDAEKQIVEILSLPNLSPISTIGEDLLDSGETNMDILTLPDGRKHVYVSDDHKITALDLKTGAAILSFSPDVESIEEVLADSYHQIIYVPEENGVESKIHPGGAITAYHADGKGYLKNNSNIFGQGLFTGDEEGITLHACIGNDGKDDGRGVIIVVNQSSAPKNRFEFFDRITWEHLGSLALEGVSGTDGIAVIESPLPGYPHGILAVSNSDKNVALISWEKVMDATNIRCANE